jgi:hypothetical protein
MAELRWEGSELLLHLTRTEEFEAIHRDLRFPASVLIGVEILNDALGAVHGIRAPGTGIPGLVEVGTYRHRGGKSFAVVHHDTPRGVRITLQDADFDELLIGCPDPETTAARLASDTR